MVEPDTFSWADHNGCTGACGVGAGYSYQIWSMGAGIYVWDAGMSLGTGVDMSVIPICSLQWGKSINRHTIGRTILNFRIFRQCIAIFTKIWQKLAILIDIRHYET